MTQAMTIDEALTLARQLMDAHGLGDWTVQADRAKRRAGMCNQTDKVVSLSRHLIPLYDRADVTDVILHEIAHALVGASHGHDLVWKAQAAQLGARPRARLPKDLPTLPGTWVGVCPNGHRVERFRRPRGTLSCAQCCPHFNRRYVLQWSRADNGIG